jgi:hypothetical protein
MQDRSQTSKNKILIIKGYFVEAREVYFFIKGLPLISSVDDDVIVLFNVLDD